MSTARRAPLTLLAAALALATAIGAGGDAAAQASAGTKPPAGSAPRAAKPRTSPPPKPSATKKSPAAPPATRQSQQSLQREQRELQAELARLKRQLAAAETSRSEASDALANAERAISAANRRLRELAQDRARIEQQLAVLAERERQLAGRQGGVQRERDDWLRAQQRLALREPLHALIDGADPGQRVRDRRHLDTLDRVADEQLSQLASRRAELAELQVQTREKNEELAQIAENETKSRQLLESEQARRKRALDQLGKQIATQRQSIARLQRDDRRLTAVIDRITSVLAEQARRQADAERRRAEREAAARLAARSKAPPNARKPGSESPEHTASVAKTLPTSTNFAEMKGRLALPVQGTIVARFGGPRRGDDGSAGPPWKGLFIRAPEGADVRSVGSGQVVFADWLRGFGNLLVIDHGDGYLSVYGNNQALLRNAGEKVAVGDVVASVGNTGGNETPGLYFELRFQGRPFDPLGWVPAR